MKGSPSPRIEEAKEAKAEGSADSATTVETLRGGGAQPIDPSEVFRHYGAAVGRWAHRLGGPSVDVDDVVQEVFVRVYENLPRFRGESKLSTWLFQITLNEVRQRRRRDRWWGFLKPRDSDEDEPEVESQSAEDSPLSRLERKQDIDRLYKALDALKEKYRVPLVMFEIEGMSGEDIAEVLNVSVSTVWVWLHRGRSQLLAQLTAMEARS